jgi:hypothetical protein
MNRVFFCLTILGLLISDSFAEADRQKARERLPPA